MTERTQVLAYCMTFPEVYADEPFHDSNWVLMRCKRNKKSFAMIFKKDENIWINVKCDPEWREFWRSAFEAVIPAYHMNKTHWNSIVLDGSIPEAEVKRMIAESFDLVKPRSKKRGNSK